VVLRPADRLVVRLLVLLAALALIGAARSARADPPSPELMARLADYADRLEQLRTHSSYVLEGRWETLGGDGTPQSIKDLQGRVEADGIKLRFIVFRYVEDGEDKTEDARKQARDYEKKRDPDKKTIRNPFFAQQQSRYTFDQVQVDSRDPARVRIAFSPKVREEDTIEGSVWVDSRQGTPLTAGFRLVKTGLFVDYVNFTLEFGQSTALGPAVSTVGIEGRTGILFFRKRFRASATLHDYHLRM
jgi:hypothetical protein